MAKKIKLTVGELFGLEHECNDILTKKLVIKVKSPIMDVQKTVIDVLEVPKKLQNELIKTYGEQKPDGRIEVDKFKEDGTMQEKYIEFVKEFNEVLVKEYEIEVDVDAFTEPVRDLIGNIETELDYRVLLRKVLA